MGEIMGDYGVEIMGKFGWNKGGLWTKLLKTMSRKENFKFNQGT